MQSFFLVGPDFQPSDSSCSSLLDSL